MNTFISRRQEFFNHFTEEELILIKKYLTLPTLYELVEYGIYYARKNFENLSKLYADTKEKRIEVILVLINSDINHPERLGLELEKKGLFNLY